MLESARERLCDARRPALRLARQAARRGAWRRCAPPASSRVPMTTGLLIGIGETRARAARVAAGAARAARAHGHLQELIIQNFRAKPGTRMAHAPEPTLEEQLWTIAVSAAAVRRAACRSRRRPICSPERSTALVRAGINDWGGVSPVTPDHVNPEAPWPHLADARASNRGRRARRWSSALRSVPPFAREPAALDWIRACAPRSRRCRCRRACARTDALVSPAQAAAVPASCGALGQPAPEPRRSVRRARSGAVLARGRDAGRTLERERYRQPLRGRGRRAATVLRAADALRRDDGAATTVTYVVNRNINYTNICLYHCGFCAFSKGRSAPTCAVRPTTSIWRRSRGARVEAWAAGATEVCLQGGIHPSFTGQTYLDIVAAVKAAVPDMHVHAFSPLEIRHGAQTLGLLAARATSSDCAPPGCPRCPAPRPRSSTMRYARVICPDKLNTARVARRHRARRMRSACAPPPRSCSGTSISRVHWARHLLRHARPAGATPAASPSSCRCRSCTWRRRCGARAAPAPARPCARRC